MFRPTLLVVSDEAVFHELCRDALAGESNCAIEAAATGDAARVRLGRGGIDLLISDLTMAGVDGFELLRHAPADHPPPELVLVAGSASSDAEIQALQSGAHDYLPRPCHAHRLRHSVCACLEQLRLRHENNRLHGQLRLNRKGMPLAAHLDIEALLREALAVILDEAGERLRGVAFLSTREGIGTLVCAGGMSEALGRSLVERLLPQLPAGSRGVRLDAAPLQLVDGRDDLRQLWLFPLRADSAMQGALIVANAAGRHLPDLLPVESLQFLGEQAATGFRNACRFQGVRELIYIDDLTGLYNHRYLQIALEREIRRAQRYGLNFSLAFIDLDLFKRVNDTFGHLVGSNMLREVGTILRRSVREIDLLFRYGGDEFTALLVGTDSAGAGVVTERIRHGIETHPFTAGQGQTCRVTATIGYATYPTHTTSRQQLVDLADQAMYRGKQSRNVICSAGPVDPA